MCSARFRDRGCRAQPVLNIGQPEPFFLRGRSKLAMARSLFVRWSEKINRRSIDQCWIWTGSVGSHGYGQIFTSTGKPPALAHRLAWEFTFGTIPPDLTVDHTCFNKLCCNTAHLRLVTRPQNARSMPVGWDGGKHNRSKTKCRRGHRYTSTNTYVDKNGWRSCRRCARDRMRKARA